MKLNEIDWNWLRTGGSILFHSNLFSFIQTHSILFKISFNFIQIHSVSLDVTPNFVWFYLTFHSISLKFIQITQFYSQFHLISLKFTWFYSTFHSISLNFTRNRVNSNKTNDWSLKWLDTQRLVWNMLHWSHVQPCQLKRAFG